jgi:hypothetical protein
MTTSLVKTSKDRSPRYPVISLPEALKRAVRVWKRDRRNKIPKEVVAEHMGYTTLNGASLGAIAAAFKYGLLEGSREAMGVTERAVAIFVHEKGSPEWTEAVRAAARGPALFRMLDEKFPDGGSDQAIRSYLITQAGFLPDAAVTLVRVYRETIALVADSAPAYDSPVENRHTEEKMATAAPTMGSVHPHPAALMPQASAGTGRKLRVLLTDDGVEVEATIKDVPTLRKLIRMLQANEAMLSEEDEGGREIYDRAAE